MYYLPVVFHVLNLLLPFSILKAHKIQIKKAACCYPTGCAFGKSTKLFTAGYRTPVGFHPTGQHQFQVFARLMCLIVKNIVTNLAVIVKPDSRNFLFFVPALHLHTTRAQFIGI
jgi:hypothetical protein